MSVIIPTYNCRDYIRETLDSVLAQTHPDVELIVIDDGSTDGTPDIARAHAPAARVVVQRNAGVCRARNAGIAMSSGQFVCLMDHDDYWYPDKLERQVRAFAEHADAGVVYSSFLEWHRDERNGGFPPPAVMRPTGEAGIDPEFSGWIYHQFLLDCWMLTSTAMFRRDVFDRVGTFDEGLPYSEDWDLWLRLSRQVPFLMLRNATTLYRQHRSQGNKMVRPVDYRTRLLTTAIDRWGYASPDGRSVSPSAVRRKLAQYHLEFAVSHLRGGDLPVARRSLWLAWRCRPAHLRPLAMMAASFLGWRATPGSLPWQRKTLRAGP